MTVGEVDTLRFVNTLTSLKVFDLEDASLSSLAAAIKADEAALRKKEKLAVEAEERNQRSLRLQEEMLGEAKREEQLLLRAAKAKAVLVEENKASRRAAKKALKRRNKERKAEAARPARDLARAKRIKLLEVRRAHALIKANKRLEKREMLSSPKTTSSADKRARPSTLIHVQRARRLAVLQAREREDNASSSSSTFYASSSVHASAAPMEEVGSMDSSTLSRGNSSTSLHSTRLLSPLVTLSPPLKDSHACSSPHCKDSCCLRTVIKSICEYLFFYYRYAFLDFLPLISINLYLSSLHR